MVESFDRHDPVRGSASELWRSIQPTPSELRTARRRLHAKAFVTAGLLLGSYWMLVISDHGVLLRLAAAGLLILAVVTVATGVMHDANHGAFSKHRTVNR